MFDMQLMESGPIWLLEKISSEIPIVIEKIVVVLWSVWFARNQKIWEAKNITPIVAVDISRKQVQEWQEARSRKKCLSMLQLLVQLRKTLLNDNLPNKGASK